ncbi:hypothetical protein Tco_1025120 [Tanacetum coccineum]
MRRLSLTHDETSVVADEVGNGNATTEDAKKNRKKKDKENEKKVAATTTSGEKPLAKKVPNHLLCYKVLMSVLYANMLHSSSVHSFLCHFSSFEDHRIELTFLLISGGWSYFWIFSILDLIANSSIKEESDFV